MSAAAPKITEGQGSKEQFSKAQHWLEVSGSRVGAEKGFLLLRRGNNSAIISAFPNKNDIDEEFQKLAFCAFQEHRVIQRIGKSGANSHGSRPAWIAFSVRVAGRPAVVAFQLSVSDSKSDATLYQEIGSRVLRREDDSISVAHSQMSISESSHKLEISPAAISQDDQELTSTSKSEQEINKNSSRETENLIKTPSANETNKILEEQSAVISSLATILDQNKLEQSLHSFANCIAKNFECLRVTIGLEHSGNIDIKAISGVVDFDPRSALMVDIAQALKETIASTSMITLPGDSEVDVPPQGHLSLVSQLKNPALCSFPLVDDKQIVGAVLLERDHKFTEQEQQQLQRMALLLSPIIALKKLEAMGSVQWMSRFLKSHLQSLLGTSKLGLKLILIALTGFLVWSSLYTTMFVVDAQAAIEARVQRAVVAYAPGYLSQVNKKAGDIVRQGDLLGQLDVEDLELDRIKWLGERDKLTKEYRANLAQRDRSNIRILEARRSQAQAQLDLIDAKIERATLRAPIDGVVISGDLSQAVGSPVDQGQLLFEVASLEDYRLSLMVDEADIGWVEIGKKGNLRLRSLPEQVFPFSITAITPVSEPGQGANIFRVEASLEELPKSFRPGMGGFAKIEVEPRAIGWIWSRSFMDWLRMESWKYGI